VKRDDAASRLADAIHPANLNVGLVRGDIMRHVMSDQGQTAPSSFVTAAARLAPIADVPGGDSDPPITPPVAGRF